MHQEDLYDSLEEEFSSASSLSVVTAKRRSISKIPTLKERHREENPLKKNVVLEEPKLLDESTSLLKDTAGSLEESASPLEDSISLLEESVGPVEGSVSPVEGSVSPVADIFSPVADIVSPVADIVSPKPDESSDPALSLNTTTSEEGCYFFKNEDVSAIVPFYGGEKYKSEIDSFVPKKPLQQKKRSERSFASVSKQSLSSLSERFFNKSYKGEALSGIDSLSERPPARSYLEMFQARNGYQPNAKKRLEDTTRSLFGDSEISLISTSTSDKDAFKDAQENLEIETASMYLDPILESAGSARHKSVSRSSSISPKLSTVSDICPEQKRAGARKLKISRSRLVPPVLVNLGGLGPDVSANQNKLERRKKQLSYGEKVSKRNRIKMMEINALKKLKEEMKNSAAL